VNATASDEITNYVAGVRRALAGVAETTREELLEDLPEHLAEVQAEGTGTLVERLGTPQAYATELLATAGPPAASASPLNRLAQLIQARDQAVDVLRRADVRVGPVIGYPKASEFLVLLRPAWWVLRGYLLAMAIAYLLSGSAHDVGLLPRLAGSELVALVLLAGCIVVSIMVGRRTLTTWPRYALWAGTAVLVLFALNGFFTADDQARDRGGYTEMGSYDANPYSNVDDVFVYDGQGRLVTGARLYDQDGNPIQLGDNWCVDPDSGESDRSRSLGYPRCPENAPFGAEPNPAPSLSTAPSLPAPPPGPAGSTAPPSGPAAGSPPSSAPAGAPPSAGRAPAATPAASRSR
jgi:hypothetical protein